MKNITLLLPSLALAFVLVGLTGVSALAQQEQTPALSADAALPALPNPGLKPGDFFYFLDTWRESIQEFFTFNPENRATLQARFALERIAEVNALLEARGIEAPGLDTAQEKIRRNMERANEILEQQRARGREISTLAKRLEAEFDTRQNLFESVLDAQETRIEANIEEKEAEIEAALAANNFQKVVELRAELEELKTKQERLEALKERFIATLDAEEKRMELKMEARERERDALEDNARRAFNEQKRELQRTFKERRMALQEERRALEAQLREATVANDVALIEQIKDDLLNLRTEAQTLREERKILREELREMREGIRPERPKEAAEVSFETIKQSAYSGYEERGRYVIQTAEAWASLRNKMAQGWRSPTIDFNQHMVIAVFQGLQNTGGFSITITDVVEYENYVKVSVTETAPGPDDIVTMALTQPAHIIKLERIEKKVVFDIRKENGRPERAPRPPRLERPIDRPGMVPPRELPRPIIPPGRLEPPRERISCRTDFDCLGLICPMVVGGDTPQCNEETGKCFCGPGRDAAY
jgi:hypothetical protein